MAHTHPPIDTLVVLGARLNSLGQPGRVARLRLVHALKLWRDLCPGGCLIITGGLTGRAPVSEAGAMARWALEWVQEHWGPAAREQLGPCLVLEEESLNTSTSATNTLFLIQNLNLKAVGLVSDALHLRRAYYLFRRHFARHRIALYPFPVPGVWKHYWRERRYLWLGKMALREGGAWLKVLGHRALGR